MKTAQIFAFAGMFFALAACSANNSESGVKGADDSRAAAGGKVLLGSANITFDGKVISCQEVYGAPGAKLPSSDDWQAGSASMVESTAPCSTANVTKTCPMYETAARPGYAFKSIMYTNMISECPSATAADTSKAKDNSASTTPERAADDNRAATGGKVLIGSANIMMDGKLVSCAEVYGAPGAKVPSSDDWQAGSASMVESTAPCSTANVTRTCPMYETAARPGYSFRSIMYSDAIQGCPSATAADAPSGAGKFAGSQFGAYDGSSYGI